MAQPTTRTEFREWCLRKLGKPVIEINVDIDQIEDRIDNNDTFKEVLIGFTVLGILYIIGSIFY